MNRVGRCTNFSKEKHRAGLARKRSGASAHVFRAAKFGNRLKESGNRKINANAGIQFVAAVEQKQIRRWKVQR